MSSVGVPVVDSFVRSDEDSFRVKPNKSSLDWLLVVVTVQALEEA